MNHGVSPMRRYVYNPQLPLIFTAGAGAGAKSVWCKQTQVDSTTAFGGEAYGVQWHAVRGGAPPASSHVVFSQTELFIFLLYMHRTCCQVLVVTCSAAKYCHLGYCGWVKGGTSVYTYTCNWRHFGNDRRLAPTSSFGNCIRFWRRSPIIIYVKCIKHELFTTLYSVDLLYTTFHWEKHL